MSEAVFSHGSPIAQVYIWKYIVRITYTIVSSTRLDWGDTKYTSYALPKEEVVDGFDGPKIAFDLFCLFCLFFVSRLQI